jgi:Ca2+-binding EF-hand superfamily protein
LFERLDRNKDGFVTREEARDAAELQGRFAELDKDNDGKISASEMRELDSSRSATGR